MVAGLPHTLVQTEYANHLKVLCSKGMVLSIQEKVSVKTSGECKEADPPRRRTIDEVSKGYLLAKAWFPQLSCDDCNGWLLNWLQANRH